MKAVLTVVEAASHCPAGRWASSRAQPSRVLQESVYCYIGGTKRKCRAPQARVMTAQTEPKAEYWVNWKKVEESLGDDTAS
jgi:hypothetical protein